MPQNPGDVTLIYRASSAEDLVFQAELDALAQSRGARVFYVLGHRTTGRTTWLPQSAAHRSDVDPLRQLVPDIAEQDVYLCGAESWMDAAEQAALDAGVPRVVPPTRRNRHARIVVAVMGTISTLVMLFSYHTSNDSGPAAATTGTSSDSSASTSDTSSEAVTYTGDEVSTEWGIVQVEITVENGKITASDAIQYPNSNHKDQEINAYAVPLLNTATVETQNASIDSISGATVTSDGYVQSLQSAIDQATL